MLAHTDTAAAPWTLVAANDKRHARVESLEAIVRCLEKLIEES